MIVCDSVRVCTRTVRVCTLTLRVDLFGDLQSVGVGQIRVGRGDGQHQAVLFGDELHQHFSDLGLDVRGLVTHGHFGHPRQVHQGQVQHWGKNEEQE